MALALDRHKRIHGVGDCSDVLLRLGVGVGVERGSPDHDRIVHTIGVDVVQAIRSAAIRIHGEPVVLAWVLQTEMGRTIHYGRSSRSYVTGERASPSRV